MELHPYTVIFLKTFFSLSSSNFIKLSCTALSLSSFMDRFSTEKEKSVHIITIYSPFSVFSNYLRQILEVTTKVNNLGLKHSR